jgi:hypothetical protein
MDCPYCNQELNWHDYYGFYLGHDQWDKQGDIFKCKNEECEVYEQHFYTDEQDNLHEGYPC